MVKNVFKIVVIFIIVGTLLTNISLASVGTVTGEKVNIREKANAKSIEVSLAKKGEKVEIIGEEDNWYKVKFEGVTGYINKDYVDAESSGNTTTTTTPEPTETQTPAPAEQPTPTEQPTETPAQEPSSDTPTTETPADGNSTQVVETEKYSKGQTITFEQEANLKYLPNFSSRVQAKAEKGSTYTVKAVLNNWVKVSNDTNYGWVLKTNIEGQLSAPEQEPAEVPADPTTPELAPTPVEQPAPAEQPTETPATHEPSSDNAAPASEPETKQGKVIVDSAVIRKSPNGDRIDSLPNGTKVTILGEENNWYHIKTDEYESAYIAERLVKEL